MEDYPGAGKSRSETALTRRGAVGKARNSETGLEDGGLPRSRIGKARNRSD